MISQLKVPHIIAGASVFTVALAWNEAFKTAVHSMLLPEKDTIISMFIYAIVTTIIVMFVILILQHTEKTVKYFSSNNTHKLDHSS
jgi:hypothetical protein